MGASAGTFHLSKHYLDCVSEDGAVCIGYLARLRWGPLSVRYCALLECDPDGTRRERHSYRRAGEPVVSGGSVDWRCAPLGVSGRWSDALPWQEITLLDGEAGRVEWQVLAPRARAIIERPAGLLTGWGYVERLELTIEPWRLPFDTLHWGRFHSESDVLVWIGWDGDVRLRHIRHNSELLAGVAFGERVLQFEPGRELLLLDTRTVHDAPIVAVLDRLPRVLRRVPPSFMAAREVKWLSRARLSNGDQRPASGWALHERVDLR